MAEWRKVLREWFQSDRRRPLSLAEKKMLSAVPRGDYLQEYTRLEREFAVPPKMAIDREPKT